jgi:hypothetical protein
VALLPPPEEQTMLAASSKSTNAFCANQGCKRRMSVWKTSFLPDGKANVQP